MPPDPQPVIALIYGSLLLLSGVACFAHFMATRSRPTGSLFQGEMKVLAWNIHTADFTAGAGAMIAMVMLILLIIGGITLPRLGEVAVMMIGSLAMHLSAIASLLILRRIFPDRFLEPFSGARVGLNAATKYSLYAFLLAVPALIIVTAAWQFILETLGMPLQEQAAVQIILEIDSALILLGMAALAVVLAPVSEELIFRGCLYRFLKAKIPMPAALVITSAIFSVAHMNLAAIPTLFLLGLVMTLAYEKSGSIKAPILIHGIFNLNTVILLGLQRFGE